MLATKKVLILELAVMFIILNKLKFKDKIYLRLGLSIGAINQSIYYSKAVIENPNDPSLFSNTQNKTSFDANAGFVFVLKDFEFGFAVPQLLNNKISYVSNNDTRTFYTQSRHYMNYIQYKFIKTSYYPIINWVTSYLLHSR